MKVLSFYLNSSKFTKLVVLILLVVLPSINFAQVFHPSQLNTTKSNPVTKTQTAKPSTKTTVVPDYYKKLKQADKDHNDNFYYEAFPVYYKYIDHLDSAQMFNVGYMYFSGNGVKENVFESIKWFKEAAYLRVSEAMFNLGCIYEFGDSTVKQDYNEAFKWYMKATQLKHSGTMFKVGYFYNSGLGMQIDYTEALKFYKMAVDLGSASAENNIGSLYENGQGVSKDISEAIRWYKKAAKSDVEKAKENL
jgi:TPR repeat protein